MEKKELVVCDTNILIEVIDRNNQKVIDELIDLGTAKLCISSISYSEIILGATHKTHLTRLIKELDRFPLLQLTPTIDLIHRRLLIRYGLSHGLCIQDALIAATVLDAGCSLFTINRKDFKFIEGLNLIR